MRVYSGCNGCGVGQSAPMLLSGYGQATPSHATLGGCQFEDTVLAEILVEGISWLIGQMGGTVTSNIWESDGKACVQINVEPFVLSSGRTISSLWVDAAMPVVGDEMLDAIGEGFIELVRRVDDLNRDLELASSNHRIDMGSIVIEESGGQARFSVDVYPPVGSVSPEEEATIDPIGPLEPTKKRPKWFIPVGIGAGVLAVAGVIGAVAWSGKRR